MEKKIGLILNAVLLIAVIVLFTKVYSEDTKELAVVEAKEEILSEKEVANILSEDLTNSSRIEGLNIAYIQIDSLELRYEYAKDMMRKIESKMKVNESTLQAEYLSFQEQVKQAQEAQASMTQSEMQLASSKLQQMQEQLYAKEEKMRAEMMQYQGELNARYLKKISNFLDKYSVELGYDYILAVSPVTPVLFANKQLNITNEVVVALNADYKAEKAK